MGKKHSFRHLRFEIDRLLATGGMGKVYLARDLLEGERQVALKVYPARYPQDRLRNEFLALRELHHPGIARALHFGLSETDAAPFFTLEYVRGEPIDQYLSAPGTSRPLDPGAQAKHTAAVLELFLAVTAVVAYLHRRGVLHLDIKPDNILVVDLGHNLAPRPVLIDFGLVRNISAPATSLGHATVPYAPPEVFVGDAPSPASDVYSLAATFYHLVAGRLPVAGKNLAAFRRAHRTGTAAPIPEAPTALGRLLLRALAKDPAQRFKDAGELYRALNHPQISTLASGTGHNTPVLFHEPDLVGRRKELERVLKWLDTDRRQGPIFEVCGGGGHGKTRFLEKVQTIVETRGKKVLALGRAESHHDSVLDACARGVDILSPSSPPRGRVSGPKSRAKPSARHTTPRDTARHSTVAAREEAARIFSSRLQDRVLPLLSRDTFLLVDDMHLASPLERRFFEDTARALGAMNTPPGGGIVVARKKPEAESDEETPWKHAGLSTQVELGPLSLEEALGIDLEGLDGALARFSAEKARSLKTALYRHVGGHPLFYVRGLLDLAGDPRDATRLAPTERVLTQVSRLEPRERDVAACMACLGRPSPAAELAGILTLDRKTSQAVVQYLRRLGLLATDASNARIIHDSVAEAILSSISSTERSRMHERIADHLSRSQRAETIEQAAWHFFEAGQFARGVETAERWIASGTLSPTMGDRSVATLQKAAEVVGHQTEDGGRFLEASGDVLEILGRFEDAVEVRSEPFEDTRRKTALDANAVRRRRKLGAGCHRAGRIDLAFKHLDQCVTRDSGRVAPIETLRAHADLALLHHFQGNTEHALEHSRRGLEIWKRSSARERNATIQSAINFHTVQGQIHIRRLELDRAIAVLRDGVTLARKIGSRTNTALLLNNLALANHLAGRFATALATFKQAERIAKDLGDAAALVSVRSNVAQILARKGNFRAARELLDETEESLAVTQSKRLRLGCLYTRGLILNLLGLPAEEIWSMVESLGAEVGDSFLVRFARLYQAEGHMSRGDYSHAKRLLLREDGSEKKRGKKPAAKGNEPILQALKTARLAVLEACIGHLTHARKRRKAMAEPKNMPTLLRGWNELYGGISATETADWAEARARLAKARKIFHSTGLAIGEIECALALADLHLRASALTKGTTRKLLDLAEKEIRAARQVDVEVFADVSPRSRELRASLLEGRLLLRRLSSHPVGKKRPRRKTASSVRRTPRSGWREEQVETEKLNAMLHDTLARAAGDPAVNSVPDLRLSLECLSAAAARLAGDAEASRAACGRAEVVRAELAHRLDPVERPAYLERDPWIRFGLGEFRPPAGASELGAGHAKALANLLRETAAHSSAARESGTGPDSGSRAAGELPEFPALDEIGHATGAARVDVWTSNALLATWSSKKKVSGAQAEEGGPAHLLSARCTFQGSISGKVQMVAPVGHRFVASDETFLEAAANALAPHVAQSEGSQIVRGSPTTRRTDSLRRDDTHSGAKTATLQETSRLHRTRRLSPRSLRTGPLAQFLKAEGMIATGREMLKVLRAARALATTELPVLITGDSGTGKSLLARVLHRLSPRADGPFIGQNASTVPPELFEADLFGYEQGAFTGAERARTGFLFQAAEGTFHLEEVGDMELPLQLRLLRVIEEKSVRPVGATSSRSLDVRFIASTQRDLDAMVRRGEFRKDLFYRLNGARIHLPSLNQRKEEIEPLVSHYWQELTGSTRQFAAPALQVLQAHNWPGNVRELVSVLRRLSIETVTTPTAAEMQSAIGETKPAQLFPGSLFESRDFEEVERLLERSYLEHLLGKYEGDLEAIAAALNTTTRSVYRRFERLGLKPKHMKLERR